MAFLKKARAGVVHRDFSATNWQNFVRQNGNHLYTPSRTAAGSPNLVAQASEILNDNFDPKNYLLTHATIVASVDVSEVSNVRLGSVQEGHQTINRKWADYRVSENCDKFINNNHDCWSRPVLLKAYRTFVGAHNFVEHVQIEDQSKGRIIDAVARDIGDSVYVDILVATHRKHASLVDQINSGRMSTMSMGCTVTETQCTKCGNVATDETDMCEHIKYAKGSYEYDELGRRYRIAELCGHESLDPTGGVHFIEASWVAVPAFSGAVMRNILEPDVVNVRTQKQIRNVLASPPAEWQAPEAPVKAASLETPASWPTTKVGFDFEEEEESGEEEEKSNDNDPLQDVEKEVEKYVLTRVKNRLKEKMRTEQQQDAAYGGELAVSKNENINKQAAYKSKVAGLVRTSQNDADLLNRVASFHESVNIRISRDLYVATLRVGSTAKYGSISQYLARCAKVLGRQPNRGEAKALVSLGRILSLRNQTRS